MKDFIPSKIDQESDDSSSSEIIGPYGTEDGEIHIVAIEGSDESFQIIGEGETDHGESGDDDEDDATTVGPHSPHLEVAASDIHNGERDSAGKTEDDVHQDSCNGSSSGSDKQDCEGAHNSEGNVDDDADEWETEEEEELDCKEQGAEGSQNRARIKELVLKMKKESAGNAKGEDSEETPKRKKLCSQGIKGDEEESKKPSDGAEDSDATDLFMSDLEFDDTDSELDSDLEEVSFQDIFGNKPNPSALVLKPPSIKVPGSTYDVCFHPSKNHIAISTFDGAIYIYEYSASDENQEVTKIKDVHHGSIRAVSYDEFGKYIYSVSSDQCVCIYDLERNRTKKFYKYAHDDALSCLLYLNPNAFVTGDDSGTVKFWDPREAKAHTEFHVSPDSVEALEVDEAQKFVAAAMYDGQIVAFDVNQRKMFARTPYYEKGFLSMCLLWHDTRLLCGDVDGTTVWVKWGEFDEYLSMFKEHPDSVNCLFALSDKKYLAGYENGEIRAFDAFPDRAVGIVGQHDDRFAINNMSVSCDATYLASCAADDIVRFWNIDYLYSLKKTWKKKLRKKKRRTKRHIKTVSGAHLESSRIQNHSAFYVDLPDYISSSDDEYGNVEDVKNVLEKPA